MWQNLQFGEVFNMNECTGQLSKNKKPEGAQNTDEVHDAKIG